MKIHSAPFFESSSLKTRFSSKNAKILDQKQKRRKKKGLWRLKVHIYNYIYWWSVVMAIQWVLDDSPVVSHFNTKGMNRRYTAGWLDEDCTGLFKKLFK